MARELVLRGAGELRIEEVAAVARDPEWRVRIDESGEGPARLARTAAYVAASVEASHAHINHEDPEHRRRHLIYGVTTGFGHNKNQPLESLEAALTLQRNLILSHACGVGITTDPEDLGNYMDPDVVRALMLIRAGMFLRGFSGVRMELVKHQVALLNRNIIPLIPKKGSVGSSGDLAPLAHLALVIIGEGQALLDGRIVSGAEALEAAGLEPYVPTYKEGLALTNGTTATLAVALLVLHDAKDLLRSADILVAMSVEAILGSTRAFESFVHELRPHPGQILSAQNIRRVFAGSALLNQAGEVQNVYSLRCAPQVHGAAHDTWRHAAEVIACELNAVTDNPLFDADDPAAEKTIDGGQLCAFSAYSAGNFHGEPLGFVMDFLAIAMSEIACISERRIQMLIDAGENGADLPQDLVADHGLNSGFMILQYSAAALVSENKVLSHPASVDSIPTSSNAEDHVAMAPHAAAKARDILRNALSVLGIELFALTQALCYRTGRLAWPKGTEAPVTVSDAELGAGTRAGFALALAALGEDGFRPYTCDDRIPAHDARRARRLLEQNFAEQVAKAAGGVEVLSFRESPAL